ncbi:glycosyltransferase [Rhodopirellula sp. JC740]|uniref:Glycosyltransferase n=1 Tax=Rhodopirellula halodulae TaxID=2894198 RepID=A0ABS8NPC1_9BACT|nr:glycosyltransferase [Rhodopirellula sp. JC740]MCC9645219.1 glycosyltransferase [Rhodopirellula sp. JC740]
MEADVAPSVCDFSVDSPSAKRAASISLILPAWNEAQAIANAVAEADAALKVVTDDYEVIVVDDGSTDDTALIVEEMAVINERIRLVQHSPNQGYGAAIRSGFAASANELVVFTDADCQFDLTELDRFVLLSDRYDVVCGYRIDRKDTPLRCLYSKVYNLLVQVLLGTGVRDVDCALKMFHRDVAKRLKITGNGFLVNSEMLTQAKRFGCRIVEVGVSHRPRTLGESTVSVRHIPEVLTSLVRYWWNEMQFPVEASHVAEIAKTSSQGQTKLSASSPTRDGYLQIALLVVAAVFMLTNLSYPLIDRDETRYAEIPREMIATGNWILPQLNFQTYYDKPPLLYWLCAISFKRFGISETSARLVPALAALATLASTMFFGSRIFGRRIGLIAGGVLMLSVGFAFTSRYLLLDGVLSLFVSLSLFTAYEAIRPRGSRVVSKPRFGWWVLSGICVGLAFLTKGPVALVLWLPPVFAMAWLSEAHAKPRWWHYGILGMVAATVAVPWFIAVHQQDPTFLIEFFYKHNVARFAGEFHPKPFWFFVPVLLVAGHPWSFLTIPYAKFLFGRSEATHSHRTPAVGYLLLWSAWCFLFFSLSKCKLPTYLLPAAPAFALMIGHYLNEVLRDPDNPAQHFFARFWSARSATAATSFAGVAFVMFVIYSTNEPTMMLFGWAMLWATLLMTSLLLMADRHQAKIAWGSSSGVAFLFAVMVMHAMVPAYSRSNTLFGESSPLVRQLAVDAQSSINQLPMATIDHEFSGVPFYLNRGDIVNFADVHDEGLSEFVSRSESTLLVVDDRVAPKDVLQQLPEHTKLTEVARRGCARIFEARTEPILKTLGSPRIALMPENVSLRSQR